MMERTRTRTQNRPLKAGKISELRTGDVRLAIYVSQYSPISLTDNCRYLRL